MAWTCLSGRTYFFFSFTNSRPHLLNRAQTPRSLVVFYGWKEGRDRPLSWSIMYWSPRSDPRAGADHKSTSLPDPMIGYNYFSLQRSRSHTTKWITTKQQHQQRYGQEKSDNTWLRTETTGCIYNNNLVPIELKEPFDSAMLLEGHANKSLLPCKGDRASKAWSIWSVDNFDTNTLSCFHRPHDSCCILSVNKLNDMNYSFRTISHCPVIIYK